MGYKTGVDKTQLELLPACLDEYVSKGHICRVIRAFTEQLNIKELGYRYAECEATGCYPYDPRMMLSLYIYGYLHRVRSSRRLRDEANRNVEVMWLMDGLKPNDKTISNFRKDNSEALRKTFRVFCMMCRELGLYGGELVATDGSRFQANNSRKNNYTKTKVERELTRLDENIKEYMEALDQGDNEEQKEKEPSAEELQNALEKLKERKITYEVLKKRIETEGQVSTVDPDARLMVHGGDGRKSEVCYNIQTVVDSKNHMIVDFDVAGCVDKGNLYNMSQKAKEVLQVQSLINLADKGYYDGEDLAACEEEGVACLVPRVKGGIKKATGYTYDDFIYDRENDCYICPNQNRLHYTHGRKKKNGRKERAYSNTGACINCSQKSLCTKGKRRVIHRLPYQDVLEKVEERMKKNKALYRRRQEIVEHPFGTVKAIWGYKQFLCRTKTKISAETALAYMAYNMRRAFNIFLKTGANMAEAIV